MTILDKIVIRKKEELQELPDGSPSLEQLTSAVQARGGIRPFFDSLKSPRKGDVALIAEVKKASPSKGIIREDFDSVAIARTYEESGASCLSVLTDRDFFQGSLDYLKAIREAVDLPLLRKDFIIDDRQILEAIEWGADAILLIVAILDDASLKHLHDLATKAGLTVLVEVHDTDELKRAIAAGATLIGVNNRNLKDFSVDLGNTAEIAKNIPSDHAHLLVAESGIHSREDVSILKSTGASAILVGESLMKHFDIPSKIAELLTPAD